MAKSGGKNNFVEFVNFENAKKGTPGDGIYGIHGHYVDQDCSGFFMVSIPPGGGNDGDDDGWQ